MFSQIPRISEYISVKMYFFIDNPTIISGIDFPDDREPSRVQLDS